MSAAAIPAELASALRRAAAVTVLTGAGISAESGVPTFRDQLTGQWAKFDPAELASLRGFQRNPERVSRWYAERRAQARGVRPNPGHLALAELQARLPRCHLITQNIDGLHQRAGSTGVIELHGSLERLRRVSDGRLVAQWDETRLPPRCPETGELLRPDVVWFGEPLPTDAWEAAIAAARSCELFFSVGTSSLVYPAAALPLEARARRALLVEVNPEPTPLSESADHLLRGPAGSLLPALLAAAWPAG